MRLSALACCELDVNGNYYHFSMAVQSICIIFAFAFQNRNNEDR